MWWVIFNIKCDFLSKWEKVTPTLSVFLYTSPFHFFFCSWTKIVSSVRKCKNFPEMVIISRDVGCFMLALFYLENVMGDIQYKIWFSITVRGVPPTLSVFLYPSPFQLFSGVELKLCLLSENVEIFLKWMFYVGTSFLRTFDGWYAI